MINVDFRRILFRPFLHVSASPISTKKYALSLSLFYKSISALRRLLHALIKFFSKILCMNNESNISNKALLLYKNFFRKTFVQYHNVAVWLVQVWTYKTVNKK